MTKVPRKLSIGVVAAAIALGGRVPASAQASLTVPIRLSNQAAIPDARLAAVLNIAESSYDAIGIRIRWGIEGRDRPDRWADRYLTVSLASCVTASPLERRLGRELGSAEELAIALPGLNRVFIFCRRILQMAPYLSEHFERILGRVLAHEIGHVLLGTAAHSAAGIMRAQLDLRSDRQPGFTPIEAASIRARVRATFTTAGQDE